MGRHSAGAWQWQSAPSPTLSARSSGSSREASPRAPCSEGMRRRLRSCGQAMPAAHQSAELSRIPWRRLLYGRIPMMLSEEPTCKVRREVTGAFQAKRTAGAKAQRIILGSLPDAITASA
ncbi:uncharacterized protein LOC111178374 isoform X1 [Delphinapterus leucas]|uniref:Uncharacterized protein LOC111178374 isoform X1 n=1 Tax=Delphinapterus leucas TaxID=9749 RepID=A0A2Y9NRL7_DELLE|nr:uncharacterized protein LOC111178374 isoform X1 [Delphinapterus leucas]